MPNSTARTTCLVAVFALLSRKGMVVALPPFPYLTQTGPIEYVSDAVMKLRIGCLLKDLARKDLNPWTCVEPNVRVIFDRSIVGAGTTDPTDAEHICKDKLREVIQKGAISAQCETYYYIGTQEPHFTFNYKVCEQGGKEVC